MVDKGLERRWEMAQARTCQVERRLGTAHWGRVDEGPAGATVLVQGANRGGSAGAHGWPGHDYGSLGGGGGGKAFGIPIPKAFPSPPSL